MKKFHNDPILFISSISTGFIEIPGQISMNIYASGCINRCPGCHNKELQIFNKNLPLTEEGFFNIIEDYKMCGWVCFLGGDAVYQPKALEKFAYLSKKAGKRVCLYTGLKFSELSEINISNIDLIIDGEWDEKKGPVTSPTTNQKCYINNNGIWRVVEFYGLKDIKWDTEQHKDLTKDS